MKHHSKHPRRRTCAVVCTSLQFKSTLEWAHHLVPDGEYHRGLLWSVSVRKNQAKNAGFFFRAFSLSRPQIRKMGHVAKHFECSISFASSNTYWAISQKVRRGARRSVFRTSRLPRMRWNFKLFSFRKLLIISTADPTLNVLAYFVLVCVPFLKDFIKLQKIRSVNCKMNWVFYTVLKWNVSSSSKGQHRQW